MRRAPVGAVFVIPSLAVSGYYKHLAAGLGRQDLNIRSFQQVSSSGFRALMGISGTDMVILDHSCWSYMSKEQAEAFLREQAIRRW